MQNLPFFWPTKTLIIDDNKYFLDEIQEMLNDNDSYIFFTNPREALEYLANHTVPLDWYIDTPISIEQGVAQYNINYDTIQSIVSNKTRHQMVSNIIVDYHMPSMSGIEFCKLAVKDKFLRKTLLTASLGYSQVIKNLNQQTINGFIDKKDISTNGLLKKHINIEQSKYFLQMARFIIETLTFDNPCSAVLSIEYYKIINKIIKELDIKEYYLLNKSGLYLMLGSDYKEYYVFLFSEEDIQEMSIEAQDQDLKKEVCLALNNKEQAICYYNQDNSSCWPEYREWEKYLFPLNNVLIESKNYYYSIVNK